MASGLRFEPCSPDWGEITGFGPSVPRMGFGFVYFLLIWWSHSIVMAVRTLVPEILNLGPLWARLLLVRVAVAYQQRESNLDTTQSVQTPPPFKSTRVIIIFA